MLAVTYIRGIDLDAADDGSSLPVPEHHKAVAAGTKQRTAVDAFDSPATSGFDETRTLLEVPIYANARFAFLDSVRVGVSRPSEGRASTEGLVAPGKRCVDDILAITANGHKAKCQYAFSKGLSTYRPLGLCCRLCGYTSVVPRSLVDRARRWPSTWSSARVS